MLTRLWFVLCVIWGAVFFLNCTTRERFSFDQYDAVLVFGPFLLGVFIRLMYRYVRFGSVVRRPL